MTASRHSKRPVSGKEEKSQEKILLNNKVCVSVLGPSGMVGSQIETVLRARGHEVTTLGRRDADISFDVSSNLNVLLDTRPDYVINCIGVIPQKTPGGIDSQFRYALSVNSVFSQKLAHWAAEQEVKLIQIGTDCVFSGDRGGYDEDSKRDARDAYGISKILGESHNPYQMLIRCSVVGAERYGKASLLEWALGHPLGATVAGYSDQFWNGVTTLAFARVVSGIIQSSSFEAGTFHLVPLNEVSKFSLVREICKNSGRSDLIVDPVASGEPKDLTLRTKNPEKLARLWEIGGYSSIPSIEFLIQESFYFDSKIRASRKD